MNSEQNQVSVFSPSRALLIAGGLIAVALVLKFMAPDYISAELAQRVMGALLGLLAIAYANAVPKALQPLFAGRGNPAGEQALRRFTGIALVLGGLAYCAAWLFAPLSRAAVIGGGLLGLAMLLVVVRIAWAIWRASTHRAN